MEERDDAEEVAPRLVRGGVGGSGEGGSRSRLESRPPPPPISRDSPNVVCFLRFFLFPNPPPPSPFFPVHLRKRERPLSFFGANGRGAVTDKKEPAEMRVAIHGRGDRGKLVKGYAMDSPQRWLRNDPGMAFFVQC